MAKTINLEFEENRYTLEYNRKAIERMEKEGFSISKMEEQQVTMARIMFRGAFFKNHPRISEELTDRILRQVSNKSGLFQILAEMYAEAFESLFGDPDPNAKNVEWTVMK